MGLGTPGPMSGKPSPEIAYFPSGAFGEGGDARGFDRDHELAAGRGFRIDDDVEDAGFIFDAEEDEALGVRSLCR
jgi:hypothetical protein